MCLPERNTDRRGRPAALLAIRKRVRDWRFWKWVLVILLLLAFFAADIFAFITHALALIGLGRAIAANFGGDLTHQLLVDPRHRNHGGLFRGDRDAGRDGIGHVMAEPELQIEVLALHRGAIADALNLQLLGEAGGDAGDQIVDQAAREAPHLRSALLVLVRRDRDAMVVDLGRDLAHQGDAEFALGPFDLDGLAVDRGGDAFGQCDRLFANT